MKPRLFPARPAVLAAAIAAPLIASCASMTKQEAALMQGQITRIDERVAFLHKNTRAQADVAANLAELNQTMTTMRGQIEEFNARSQMLADRLGKIEASLGKMIIALRDETASRAGASEERMDALRKDLQRLSMETRAFIQLMEKRSGISWDSHREAMEKIAKEEGAPMPAVQRPAAPPEAVKRKMAPGELYQSSYDAYLKGDFAGAIGGFSEYIKLYPDTDLSDNASYWIGEAYYGMGDYDRAAGAFDDAARKYPASNKAPAALLKSAFALLELGATAPAMERLKMILEKYPTSNEAIQASERLSAIGAAGQ